MQLNLVAGWQCGLPTVSEAGCSLDCLREVDVLCQCLSSVLGAQCPIIYFLLSIPSLVIGSNRHGSVGRDDGGWDNRCAMM